MSTDLVTTERIGTAEVGRRQGGGIAVNSLDDLARMSKAVAESGMFRDCQTPQRAAVKMLFALAMGFDAVTGLTGVDIIEGNPTPNGHFWAAALESHPRYDYEVLRHDAEACTIRFLRDGRPRGEVTWTIADAQRAGLANKDNWKKYPRSMLFNRAMTEGGRAYCPQLFGGMRAYAPEELGLEDQGTAPAAVAELHGEPIPAEGSGSGLPVTEPVYETIDADTGEVVVEGQQTIDADEAGPRPRARRRRYGDEDSE